MSTEDERKSRKQLLIRLFLEEVKRVTDSADREKLAKAWSDDCRSDCPKITRATWKLLSELKRVDLIETAGGEKYIILNKKNQDPETHQKVALNADDPKAKKRYNDLKNFIEWYIYTYQKTTHLF